MRISDWSSDVCSSDLDESARLDAGVAAPARLPSGTWRMNPGFDEVLRAGTRTRSGLFITAAQRLGTTPQNVEKDFWVCWTLDALFNGLPDGDRKSTRLNSSH